MGHRKSAGRSSLYSGHGRKTTPIGTPSNVTHRPLSHSSPVHQSNRPPRKLSWGNGISNRSNYNEGRPPQLYGPRESLSWMQKGSGSYSTSSLVNNYSDGGSSSSSSSCSSGGSNNSGGSSKGFNNNHKKAVARSSNPLRYKTELCRSYEECGDCRFGSSCTFAHGLRELRAVLRHPRYKTDLCRTYHGSGYCQYGARCHFVHDPEETTGMAALRGNRLSIRQGANLSLMAIAENCKLTSGMIPSDFLTNLQRLHAFKAAQEDYELLDSSLSGIDQLDSIENFSKTDSLSLDMLTLTQDNTSMLSMSPTQVNMLEIPPKYLESSQVLYDEALRVPGSADSTRFSTQLDGNWWCTEYDLKALFSSQNFDALATPFASVSDMRQGIASPRVKSVIGNPMEVSRNLFLPSITELIQKPS